MLVNIAMENQWKSPFLMGKSTISTGPFSSSLFVCLPGRVSETFWSILSPSLFHGRCKLRNYVPIYKIQRVTIHQQTATEANPDSCIREHDRIMSVNGVLLVSQHVEIAKSFSMRHMHPRWVDFPAQVDAQVHSVLRSHPPEEVVLQMRKQDDTLEIVVMHYVPWDGRAPQGSHRPEPGLLRRQLRNAGWVPRGWRIPTWHDWHMRVSMNGDTPKWINDLWVPPFLGNLHHTSYMCIGPGCPIPKVAPKMLLNAFGRQQATYQIGNFALCNSKCAI